MNAETFLEQFDTFAADPNAVEQLRAMILQLAVQGKLVPQDPNDEPASQLRAKIYQRRKTLVDTGVCAAFSASADDATTATPFELPNGWGWIRLGELGGFLGGGTPSKECPEYWDGEVPWVSPKDMKRPYMHDAIDHVSALGVENSSGKMIPAGSLLMVVRGMILAHSFPVALAMRELTINQDMKALRLALPEIGEYLLRCCTASKQRMLANVERSSHGTCRLASEIVANFPVPLPPLAEQKRIVAKVDQLLGLCDEVAARQAARRVARAQLVGATLDRLVSTPWDRLPACQSDTTPRSAGSRAVAPPRQAGSLSHAPHVDRLRTHFDHLFDTPTTIPQLRQTILQLAVQGKLVPQDPNDEPVEPPIVHAGRKKEKWAGPVSEQEVPCQLPTSWKWLRTGDVSVLKHGYAFSSKHFTSEPAPFVLTTPGNFYEKGGFRDRESKRKYYKGPVDPDFILNSGDFIIPMTEQAAGLLGSPAFIPDDGMVYVHNQRLGKLTFSELIVPEYAFWYFNSDFFRGELARTCTGMKVRHTSPDRVLRVPFPTPPLAEQKQIVAKVTELLSLCDALEAQLKTAESASTQLLCAAVHHLLGGAEKAS